MLIFVSLTILPQGHQMSNPFFFSNQYLPPQSLQFHIHYMGPITMHRVGRDGLEILNIKNHVRESDTVIFVFGEIDVRCHIGKQRDTSNRTLDEIINTLTQNYVNTVVENINSYNNLTTIIMTPIPPSNNCFNANLPLYGPISDRILINEWLAKKLKSSCLKHNIIFFDVRKKFQSKTGALTEELSDGSVHIGLVHNHIIKEKLLKTILKTD